MNDSTRFEEAGFVYWVKTGEKNGKPHRVDGPALEYDSGYKAWYLDGQLVYDRENDNTDKFDLPDAMKKSIIKHKLERM